MIEPPKMLTQHEQDVFNHKARDVLVKVRRELRRQAQDEPEIFGPHIGINHIWEVALDLWDQVKADNGKSQHAADSAILIAALAIRYVIDVTEEGEHK